MGIRMLQGKHALVTGGGTGIGLAIATALARAGAQVTITGRRFQVLQSEADKQSNLHPLVMNVVQEASVVDGFQRAVAKRGPVAICVANAGIAEGRPLHDTDIDFWRAMMATNLDGAFLTIREALRTMHRLDWGRVIAVSSIAGIKGLKGASAYSASKHGMIGLIRALSEDYITTGLTFNALCPGFVDTAIVAQNVTAIAARAAIDEKDAMEMMLASNRHKRLIEPPEVAAAAIWLCGPGSASINGQAVEIAGGQV